jgi:hypothetical protein
MVLLVCARLRYMVHMQHPKRHAMEEINCDAMYQRDHQTFIVTTDIWCCSHLKIDFSHSSLSCLSLFSFPQQLAYMAYLYQKTRTKILTDDYLFPRKSICWMVVSAVHLKPTVAMLHVAKTFIFTRPFRITMYVFGSIINFSLKQTELPQFKYQKGRLTVHFT